MTKTSKSNKYVYLFGNKKADGNGSMKPLLGGKGANLAEMSRIGLPVPPGFTMTTEVCTYYYANKRTYPKVLEAQAREGMAFLEKIMGTKFGDKTAMPLLVSVRSGARDSMPGMMDTILNLGLNDQTVLALVAATKNLAIPRPADPDEVTRLVLYVASDEASFSTGSEFIVDGGSLLGPARQTPQPERTAHEPDTN